MTMLDAVFGVIFLWIAARIAWRDIQTFLVADGELFLLLGSGLLWQLQTAWPALQNSPAVAADVLGNAATRMFILGGVSYCIAVLYRACRKRDGLGFGDVKLMAVAGAWLPVLEAIKGVGVAALIALSLILIANRGPKPGWKPDHAIPFAAFLAPSFWVLWEYNVLFCGVM